MSKAVIDFLANIAGTALGRLLLLLATPAFIHFLGIEAYGVIGVYVSLIGLLQIFHFGLGQAVSRFMAGQPPDYLTADAARTARTIEALFWLIGILGGGAVAFLAHPIAWSWLKPAALGPTTIETALKYFGLAIAFQIVTRFYFNVLIGRGKQVVANLLQLAGDLAQVGGGLALLAFFDTGLVGFAIWQAASAAFHALALLALTWRDIGFRHLALLPQLESMRPHRALVFGLSGITLTYTLLTYSDRLILSRLIALDALGVYLLAANLARGLQLLFGVVYNTSFPRLCSAVAANDRSRERVLFHDATQLVMALVMPVAGFLILAPEITLLIYTGSADLARQGAPLLRILTIAMLLWTTYATINLVELAHGYTANNLRLNIIALVCFMPILVILAYRYGTLGAAVGQLVILSSYPFLGAWTGLRRFLAGETRAWLQDVLRPVLAVGIVYGIGLALVALAANSDLQRTRFALLAECTLLGALGTACAVLASPRLHPYASRLLGWSRTP